MEDVASPGLLTRSPRVSVLTIAYQHAPFIAQCIESVLRQKTRFEWEMVIGEDASSDGTREICRTYQKRHPERLRLLLPSRNLGRHENFRRTLQACRGEFIAILEGDDYWIAPDKLQKQVDALTQHPDWVMTFHNVRLEEVRPNAPRETVGPPRLFFPGPGKPVYTLDDFLEKNWAPTCSCLFRRVEVSCLPAWYFDPARNPYTDWTLHVWNLRRGAAGYLPDVMAVHRRHAGGVWGSTFDGTVSGDLQRLRDRIRTYRLLATLVHGKRRRKLRQLLATEWWHLALAAREAGKLAQALSAVCRAWWLAPWADRPMVRFGLTTLGRCFVRSSKAQPRPPP